MEVKMMGAAGSTRTIRRTNELQNEARERAERQKQEEEK